MTQYLRQDADTQHEDASDMYDSYGWHITTEHEGDIELGAIDYDDLGKSDEAIEAELREAYADLTDDEAAALIDRAREVREAMEGVADALERAVTAYEAGDLAGCIEALDEAHRLEREHGDDPATRALRAQLLTEDKDEALVCCGCGAVTGERCAWVGPLTETVIVEYMPDHLRASHEAAGNSGSYPANGAERIRCASDCAEMIVDDEDGWATIVSDTASAEVLP